jgi:hypothetical protein
MPLIVILGLVVIAITVAPRVVRRRRRAAARTSRVVLLTEHELELAVRRRLYGEPPARRRSAVTG